LAAALLISISLAVMGHVLVAILVLALGVSLGATTVMREVTDNQRRKEAFERRRSDAEALLAMVLQRKAEIEAALGKLGEQADGYGDKQESIGEHLTDNG
jgi:hypothetical protein